MSIVVVATVYPRPEHRAEIVAAFEEAMARVQAEDEGCELYALHENDDRLVMIEKWASQAALAVHSRGEALAQLNARLAGKLISKLDVQVLAPHPAGTASQGAL
jgi:quinol monooxygenase YgiN